MRKRLFYWVLAGSSAANLFCFYLVTRAAMAAGAPGVDNQAALLFIPLLWVAAFFVVALLDAGAALIGLHIPKDAQVSLRSLFPHKSASFWGCALHAGVLLLCLWLMATAFWLFFPQTLLALVYAATGGLFFLLLVSWLAAAA